MTTIEGIYFHDVEYTLKEVIQAIEERRKEKKTMKKQRRDLRFTVIVPNLKGIDTSKVKGGIKLKKDNKDWRHKYPECPDCGAVGFNGLTTTRLGSLRCRNCNSMFRKELDKDYHIKVGKSMGD